MDKDNYQRAYKAIQQAQKLTESGTEKEKALINALAKRYVAKPIEDRHSLDVAYSKAMKQVVEKFSDDTTIAVLYAESIMNLHP